MAAITIDLGGTFIKTGLFIEGSVRHHQSLAADAESGLSPRLNELNETIGYLLDQGDSSVEGIGLAFPGIVDSKRMKILSTNRKYPDAPHFDFLSWGKSQFGLEVYLESDARSALLGEWKFGSARGFDNVVMVTLGTGVGSATLIEGKLLHGVHFQAGAMGGHFSVNWKGDVCNCGSRGCVEVEASSWSLPKLIQNDPGFLDSQLATESLLDFEAVFRLARTDDLSRKIRDRCLEVWSIAVVNLVHAYDPEIVVLGGGIMGSHQDIIPVIQEAVSNRSWTPWGNARVIKSEHGASSVLLGLGHLVTQKDPAW